MPLLRSLNVGLYGRLAINMSLLPELRQAAAGLLKSRVRSRPWPPLSRLCSRSTSVPKMFPFPLARLITPVPPTRLAVALAKEEALAEADDKSRRDTRRSACAA